MSFHVESNNGPFSTQTEVNLKKLKEKDLQKQQEFIQEKSWMKLDHPLGKIPDINVDLKTLSLFGGKSFIEGTSLEGCNMATGLECFHSLTDHILKKNEEAKGHFTKYKFSSHLGKITSFRNDVANAIELNNGVADLINKGNDRPDDRADLVRAYAEKLRATFKNKKQGWLPCSWRDAANVAHSVMIHVDIEKGIVTLINTGKEIEKYHPKVKQTSLDPLTGSVKEEEKFQEFIKISKVDKKQLKHVDFFRYLVELQTNRAWYGNRKEVSEKNLYESLPAYLNGSIEPGISPLNH